MQIDLKSFLCMHMSNCRFCCDLAVIGMQCVMVLFLFANVFGVLWLLFIVAFGFLSDHIIMQVCHINASNMFTKKYRKICQKRC